MSEQLPKENPFDSSFSTFLSRYKLEILASFGLIALLGGIVLAAKVLDLQKSEVTVVPVQEKETDQEALFFVDISGAVVAPGVYELPSGSRVGEAIDAAGGLLTEEADTEWVEQYINRAEEIKDGQKIYIPLRSVHGESSLRTTQGELSTEASQSRVQGAAVGLINLNTASQVELESLPGIGPSYARRIIEARPFSSVEELLNVSGIGPKKFEALKDKVIVF